MSQPEIDETAETPENEGGAASAPPAKKAAPTSVLSRDSDKALRPGFRNPKNAKTKAQKKKRK